MDIMTLAIAAVIAGLAIGVFSGMLGIGGGTLMIPVFKLGFGMSALACTATSLFSVILTAVSGSVTHLRNKTCIPKLGLCLGLGGACTSPLGVWLASISPEWLVMTVCAVIIAYSAITMLRKALAMKPAEAGGDAAPAAAGISGGGNERGNTPEAPSSPAAAAGAPPTFTATGRAMAKCVGIGLVTGVASGYAGLGGGFLMVPLMMQLLHLPMKLTSGTSLLAMMILAVPGVVTQAVMGHVNWIAGIFMACGSVPGAAVGSKLVSRVPERALRFMFSAFLLVAAIMLVLNQLHII